MNLLFYVFSSLALLSGVLVIQARNPVHSVLFLILVFLNAAVLLVLLGLDFFALIFLVVYIGAIAVLFLFVVMMLHIKLTEIHEKKLRYLPLGGLVLIVFLFQVSILLDNSIIALFSFPEISLKYNDYLNYLDTASNIEALGEILYTYYFIYFLLASLILLVAMIGAILLTLSKAVNTKKQKIYLQNTREFTKTIEKRT